MQDIFLQIAELIKSNQKAALCVVVETSGSTPRKQGSKMLVFEDGRISGTIGGGSVEKDVIEKAIGLLIQNQSAKLIYELQEDLAMHCGGGMEIYIEPILIAPRLYIFGAGHVGKALAEFASKLGFRITLVDHREGIFNTPEFVPYTCIQGDYLEKLELLPYDLNTYCVITTPKHSFDEEIAIALSTKESAYTGMIGSTRKVTLFRERCLSGNILTNNQLDKIDMPIGIKFAAETPEEIAVSIVAKLIDVRNTSAKK